MCLIVGPKGLIESIMSTFSEKIERAQAKLSTGVFVFLFTLLSQCMVNVSYLSLKSKFVDEPLVFLLDGVLRSSLRALWWSFLFALIVVLVRSEFLKRCLSITFCLVTVVVCLFEAYLLKAYNMVYTHEVVQILAGTNLSEAVEYLQANVGVVGGLVAFLALCVLLALVLWGQRLFSRVRVSRIGFAVFVFSACSFIFVSVYTIPRTYHKVLASGQVLEATVSGYDRFVWNTYGFIREAEHIKMNVAKMSDLPLDVEIVPTAPQIDNVVLVIGETLRRDYMSAYGYPLPTTPRLDSLAKAGELLLFTDAISPAPNTIGSLTKVLSYALNTDASGKEWYEYPALPMVMKQAGYHTSWVSNQESSGLWLQVLNTFADLCDEKHYVNARSIDAERDETSLYYDEDVLPALRYSDSLAVEQKRLFQVVHLMGSHPFYSKRYPKEYSRFSAVELPLDLKSEYEEVIAQYVNSLYYNDYVVSEIIRRYADKNSLVLYFSDHGEVLYDDPSNPTYADHGMLKQGVSVPLMIYLSPKAQVLNPHLKAELGEYLNRPIMLDGLTHALPSLLGIKTKYSKPSLDFFSSTFDPKTPRILHGLGRTISYDELR